MRRKTMRLIFWGALAVLSSSLLVVAGVWVGHTVPGGGRDKDQRAAKSSTLGLENKLLDTFAQRLESADDADKGERDKALEILREADPELSRIKRENREAMRRANRHPRIVRPRKVAPAPKKKEDKSKDSRDPTKNPTSDSPGNSDQPSKDKSR